VWEAANAKGRQEQRWRCKCERSLEFHWHAACGVRLLVAAAAKWSREVRLTLLGNGLEASRRGRVC
jgi:hypothetical protein